MVKHEDTEWHLDLKPVTLPGEGVPPVDAPTSTPKLRRSDDAVLKALGQIHLAVDGLRLSVDQLSLRLAAIERRLATQTLPSEDSLGGRATRQFREPRSVRDSSTVSLERRARRSRGAGPRPVADGDAAER